MENRSCENKQKLNRRGGASFSHQESKDCTTIRKHGEEEATELRDSGAGRS